MPANADMPFELAQLGKDERTIEIVVGEKDLGSPPCDTRYRTAVDERPDRVILLVDELFQLPLGGPGCAADANPQHLTATLADRLGERELYDGIRSAPQPVSREADRVVVSVRPDGLGATDVTPLPCGGWWQYFAAADGQWSVQVVQACGTDDEPYGRRIAETIVHGTVAEIYEDPSRSERTILWRENGWHLSVYGSMTHGPPFVFGDELRQIADGIQVQRPAP